MRIGVLTGGGDCPGLNAVIRAIWKRSCVREHSLVGFLYGWRGVVEDISVELDDNHVRGILHIGGTILRTSGDNPFRIENGVEKVFQTLKDESVDALIVIGGEGTMGAASRFWNEHQLPVIGVPKTIDNDLSGTDVTFGFDSALNVATEAIDRLHSTAESHNRVMVCEVMGRHAGWLALYSGIAGGANVFLIPEIDMSVEEASDIIKRRHDRGKVFSVVVVGEGYNLRSETGLFDHLGDNQEVDKYGYPRLGGVSHQVAHAIEQLTGFETRVTVLGHVQRGGSPTPHDRVLASRFGFLAADLVHNRDFGKMVSARGDSVVGVPIEDGVKELRTVPESLFELARTFMG